MMKKIATIILSLLVCTVLFTGCGNSSKSSQEQSLKVYSFSGNSESISVSNGVIVLSGKDEICYGGNLKVMSDDFADITAYSTTIYVDGEEDSILLSHAVADQTGGTVDVSGNIGKISGDVLRDGDADKLADNLWFELKTTNLSGEENTYQVQLETTLIAGDSSNYCGLPNRFHPFKNEVPLHHSDRKKSVHKHEDPTDEHPLVGSSV